MNARAGVRRLIGFAAIWPPVAAALAGTADPAAAAGVPPNPLWKPGWILDRHDEFNGSLDRSLWITKYLESRTPECGMHIYGLEWTPTQIKLYRKAG